VRVRRLLVSTAVVLAVTLAGAGLAGCAHNALNTHDSACFRLIPEGRSSVGPKADFAGVRLLTGGTLVQAVSVMVGGHPPVPVLLNARKRQDACLVAFRGRFSPAEVIRPWTPAAGPYSYAVVVVEEKDGRVVATLLARRLPHKIGFADKGLA
jgi:hypothetical protein